jgi:SlyX protein
VNESLQARLDRLEIIYAEQEYTIQSLNDTVARQNRDISSLTTDIEYLRQQIQALRTDSANEPGSEFEIPPHY